MWKESKETKENEGKQENLEQKVLRLLGEQTPWNKIARECHVSTKTISDIRNGTYRVGSRESQKDNESSITEYGPLGKRWAGKTLGEMAAAAFRLFQRELE